MKARSIITIALNVINIITYWILYLFGNYDSLRMVIILSIVNIGVSIWTCVAEKNKIKDNNILLLIVAVLSLLTTKLISGGILLSMYITTKNWEESLLKSEKKKEKEKIDPQVKKIDILLKLGVVMIFIAGFIFATTSWYSLGAISKLLIFSFISLLFIGLSKFCEKKIKIMSTVYLYWFLGMSFILLIFITSGYTELFGNYFSFLGEGKYLYTALCSLIFSFLSLLTYYNFKESFFLNFVYTGITFTAVVIGEHLSIALEEILLLLLPVFTLIKVLDMNKENDLSTLNIFSNIMIVILGIVFIIFSLAFNNALAVVCLSILFIFNLYYHFHKNRNSDFTLAVPPLAYIAFIPVLIQFIDTVESWCLTSIIFVTILYCTSILSYNYKLKNSSLITADFITILLFVISIASSSWIPLVIALLSLFVCISSQYIDGEYPIETYINPLKITMTVYGILYYINGFYNIANMYSYWFVITLLLFVLVYCLSNKNKLLEVYEGYSVVFSIIALLVFTDLPDLLSAIIVFVSILLFYADVCWKKDKNRIFTNVIFILMLLDIYIGVHAIEKIIVSYDVTAYPSYLFSNIVSIISFVAVIGFHKEDEAKVNLSLIAIILPIIEIIENNVDVYWISVVLSSFFGFYLTTIISKMIKNNMTLKKIVMYIGYIYSFLIIVFNNDICVIGYTFIMIALALLIGFYNKNNDTLFRVGVGALIIELIYQLYEFWEQIPAWLYLLVLGLALIIFATYKQMKIIEKKDQGKKDEK